MTSVIWPVPPNGAGGTYVFEGDQDFGERDRSAFGGDNFHNGIDFSNYPGGSAGIQIKAIASGTVVLRKFDDGLGNMVRIDHGGGLVSTYCHMQDGTSAHLNQGQAISQGDPVGKIGETGEFAFGPHLHLEIHVNGSRVDPQAFIRKNLGTPEEEEEDEMKLIYLKFADETTVKGVIGTINRKFISPEERGHFFALWGGENDPWPVKTIATKEQFDVIMRAHTNSDLMA